MNRGAMGLASAILVGIGCAAAARAEAAPVTVKNAKGKTVCKIERAGKGYRIEAGGQRVRMKIKDGQIKLRRGGKVVLRVRRKKKAIKIEDGDGDKLYKVFGHAKAEADGRWKLEDAHKKKLLELRRSGKRVAVVHEKGSGPSKVKKKGGRVVLLGKGGKKALEVRGSKDVLAASWFAATSLPMLHRAAIFCYFQWLWR